ncbi:response regulator [bacterium]|nr:MAG: response regulator [bacterium]
MNSVNILLVEDDPIVAFVHVKQLEKYNYTVFHALSSKDAFAQVQEKGESIHIILMDIDLGNDLDGTEIAEEILKSYDIPIIFLSSHVEPSIVEKTERITSYGYVVKNSGIVILDAGIKMALKLYHTKKELLEMKIQAEKSEKSYIDLMESLQEGLIIANELGFISKVNATVCEMFGYSNDEMLGLHMSILYSNSADRDKMLNNLTRDLFLKNYEVKLKCKDGAIINTTSNIRMLIDANGHVNGTQGIIRKMN